jgi:hypothetical protein
MHPNKISSMQALTVRSGKAASGRLDVKVIINFTH